MAKKDKATKESVIDDDDACTHAEVDAQDVWTALRTFVKAMDGHKFDCAEPYRIHITDDYYAVLSIEVL